MNHEGVGGFHPLGDRFDPKKAEEIHFTNQIPLIDLDRLTAGDTQETESLLNGLKDIGFIFVHTPEINAKLDGVYDTFKQLFRLPPEVLQKYVHPEIHYQRGFTPSRTEIGVYCQKAGVDEKSLPDDKRAWFIGPDIARDHYIVKAYPEFYPENIWPTEEEVPGFRERTTELRADLYEVGRKVMAAIEVPLGYKSGFFDSVIADSPTLIRPLHYPEVTAESWQNSVWACEHTDINFITLLPASTKEGLWVQARDGEWIQGMAPPGYSLLQVGDMFQYLTHGEFHSAHHMVMAPNGIGTPERFSAALFVHARSDFVFEGGDRQDEYPDITAGNLLLKRLKEIGLAKKDAREGN